jgi:hypothetical protein
MLTLRLCPGPGVQDFSGSSSVTSRNSLIHYAATNGTYSPRFEAEGVATCRYGVLLAALDGSLATANFREWLFFQANFALLGFD